MTTLQIIAANQTVDISDNVTYMHIGNNGFGLPPILRLTESGPTQDGDTDLGFRLQPRIIQLVLGLLADNSNDYFDLRRVLGNILKPRNTPFSLRFTDDNSNVYQIDAHYQDGYTLDSNDKGAFGPYTHKVGIMLKANDPLFYNPTQQVYTYGVGGGSGPFSFPISFPIQFGGSTVNQTQTITYAGDYATSPIIEIHGPITDPVITNLTSGITLDFTGTTINASTYYTVDTRYGYISVTQNDGTNRIDKLVGDSNLSGFKLIAAPDAVDGLNDIQVTGTGANANTQVYIRYFEKFLVV